jgi:hypothetical protein
LPLNSCGNGIVEAGEVCDRSVGSATCTSLGFAGGTLSCTHNCTFNTAYCLPFNSCGNRIVEAGEECDGIVSLPCPSHISFSGYPTGTLRCTNDCKFDYSNCTDNPPPTPRCGDGVKNQFNEDCDGSQLGGQTCGSLGFDGGVLRCNNLCKFDMTACSDREPVCGDGIIQKPNSAGFSEQCDGDIFIEPLNICPPGSTGGPVSCKDCKWDYSLCKPIPEPGCGDGVRQSVLGEDCDGSQLGGQTCMSLGYDSGTLKCTTGCKFDKSGCSIISIGRFCGDGVISSPNDAGFNEQCDGTTLGPRGVCPPGSSPNTIANPVRCRSDCTLDYSGCTPIDYCGDGLINAVGEDCDGRAFDGKTCITMGYAGGSLSCTHGCLIDTTGCTQPQTHCGDGIVSRPNDLGVNEQCDGVVVGMGCPSEYYGGSVLCTRACTYDYSNCNTIQPPRCGDGAANTDNEQCDGGDLRGRSCVTLGFTRGDLACGVNCMFDESYCTTNTPPRCGDNFVNQDFEYCDGTDLNGNSCESRGFVSGTLRCTGSCAFDPRGCSMCNNNGVCQPRMGETVENCVGDCRIFTRLY